MKRRTWYGTLALIGYVLLGLGGCAIQPGPVYTKDGKQYGVTSSQFWRGTWWQHYERALSYADGEFWDDAIASFQAAVATRLGQKDQRRANTYGLHFIDNYFPHRELGIVYYRLNRYPDALHELTTSLDQVESAKTKFYLNKVRKVLLQQGGRDTVPPRIVLDTPPDGLLTNRFTVHVTGHAEDDTYVSTIAINGQPLFIELAEPHLAFTEEIILKDGPNTVDIVAEDLLGKQTTQRLTLHLDRHGPLLSLEQVERLGASPHRRVRVQGMVSDHSRITRFVLAGQHVPLQSETASAFYREVPVAAGAASLPFEVEDAAGNITRGSIALAPAESGSRETFRWKAVPPALPRWASLHAGTVLSDFVASPSVPFQMAHNHDRDPPRITLASLEDQEVVYDDTIYLEGKVTDASAITAFSVAGESYWQHKCKQLFFGYLARLRAGQSNGFILEATDEWGNRSEYPVRVIHQVREVRQLGSRLRVLPTPFSHKGQPSELAEAVEASLVDALLEQKRFDMMGPNRALQRQDFSAPAATAKMGQSLGADAILVGEVIEKEALQSLDVYTRLLDVATEKFLVSEDVYGEYLTPPAVKSLMQGLALKLKRRFPLEEGVVIAKEGKKIWVDLSNPQGIRPGMKFILFREGKTIQRGAKVFRLPVTQLGEARIIAVSEDLLEAQLLPSAQAEEVRESDKVITK